MASEAYSWPQGTLYLYTGTATASALIGYAQNSHVTLSYGWENRPSLSGIYRDHLTGLRADLSVQALLSNDWRVMKMAASATAVHCILKQITLPASASAGILLFSGRIDSLQMVGQDAQAYTFTFNYHSNSWSSFGGNS